MLFRSKPFSWSIVTLIKLPDKASFEVSRVGQKFEVIHTADGFRWNKVPKGQEGQDLEDALRLLREYQLASVIGRINARGFRMVAPRSVLVKGEDILFQAEGNPDSYSVTLDADFRPKEIKLESKGLNSGLTILFSDYLSAGKSFYPKATQVVLPGSPRRGVAVKYEKVQINPAGVREADLAPKKGGRPLIGR